MKTLTCLLTTTLLLWNAPLLAEESSPSETKTLPRFFYGTISSQGKPIKGAMVTFSHGNPVHSLSVFADDQGRYLTPNLPWGEGYRVRVRRAGWKDYSGENLPANPGGSLLATELEKVTDASELADQLPSNYWMQLVIEEFGDDQQAVHEFKQQCTYCHQQGSAPTARTERSRAEWAALILDMGQRSAILTNKLREQLPDIFLKAYDSHNVLQKLSRYQSADGPLPVPSMQARRAVIEEWDLGSATSNQHDLMVYAPDGSIWSVDGPMDMLHKISFSTGSTDYPDGIRKSYAIPRGNQRPGGVYWRMGKEPSPVDTYLAPHSLQTAPDGRIWLTLADGNQLAGFTPATEQWEIVDLQEGINPHTLRFDKKGRLWFTVTATNHVGMFDPVSKQQRFVRLPAPDWQTKLLLYMTPFLIAHADWIDLRERSATADGVTMPMPYGIDINPLDDSVWYSQLNMSHIGRIDPETLAVTPIQTPFVTPRRLRFDSKGKLWVPSYAESSLNRYDPVTGQWQSWRLPIEPLGSEVPYSVFVDKRTDQVWITGTESDSMIRFQPETGKFTVYPLPTRVTYTRELDQDDQGNMWTSHSNAPAWHVESGIPKVTRVMPEGAPDIDASGLFSALQPATFKVANKLVAFNKTPK